MQMRQGDILLEKIEMVIMKNPMQEIPAPFALDNLSMDRHVHVVEGDATLLQDDHGNMAIRVGEKGARLTHDTHVGLNLDPESLWRVVRQREWVPERGSQLAWD